MKKRLFHLLGLLGVLLFISSSIPGKPHLIVGCYKCLNDVKISLYLGNDLSISQWYFSSDEFTAHLWMVNEDEEFKLNLAYKIYDNKEEIAEEGFDFPVILFKNPDREDVLMVFTILDLQKSGMVLHYEESISSERITFNPTDIYLERIAGPSENMD